MTRTELYRASTLVEIQQNDTAVIDVGDAFDASSRGTEEITVTMNNELRVLKSANVLKEVIDSQDLMSDTYFNPSLKKDKTARTKASEEHITDQSTSSKADEAGTGILEDASSQIVLRLLRDAVEVEQLGYSRILRLSVTADDASKAARIANATVNAYLKIEGEQRLEAARGTVEWISTQLSDLENKMQESSNAVDEFRRENGLGDEAQNIALSNTLSRLQDSFIEARRQRRAADERLANAKSNPDSLDVDTLSSLEQVVESSKVRENAIRESQRRIEDRLRRRNAAQFKLVQLERKANADAVIYERFLEQARQVNAIGQLARPNANIIELASPPLKSFGFGKKTIIGIALLAGSIVGIAAVLFMEAFRSQIVSRDELERLTGLPIISVLPLLPETYRNPSAILEYILNHPYSNYVEGLRSIGLRAPARNSGHPSVVAITSALPGEGKSSISIALTLFYAHFYGKRTILVDCDFRRSCISEALQLSNDTDIGTYLVGRASVSQVIQTDPTYNLNVIPSHRAARVVPDMLSSEKFKELIKTLKESFDIVVLDTPPITPFEDIGMIKRLCDDVLLVVSSQNSTRSQVTQAQEKLKNLDVSVSGVIFNAVDLEKEASYRGVLYNNYSEYYDA